MLDAIAAWELDAALEPPSRVFLRTEAIETIERGGARLVVGPRGAGKTAASRLITDQGAGARRAARLGLKDAFMAALRPLADPKEAARASAHARYLILLTSFETLMEEQLLGGSEIRDLGRRFNVALEPGLAEALDLVFNRSILYEVFGEPGPLAPRGSDVVGAIEGLEQAMSVVLGERRALVLLDEAVDRSIVAGALDDLRVAALGVLLAGAADLAAGAAGGCVTPVMFTRPGLYGRLPESVRRAWADRRLDLGWTSAELRALADFRVARAGPEGERGAQDGALERLFAGASAGVSAGEGAAWSFIWPRTRARPRDAVFFIRAAARNARHRNRDTLDAESFVQAEKTYSAFLLADMADEIRDAAPDIDAIMGALARARRRRMTAQDLVDLCEQALSAADSAEGVAGAGAAIERCYESSVIGNWIGDNRTGRAVFIHDAPGGGLDYGLPVVIHPGLATAFDLTYAAAA